MDTAFESKILSLLSQRKNVYGTDSVVTCEEAEGEVLREVEELDSSKDERYEDPPRTRERCRQAARRLAARGEIVVVQKGKIVDPSFVKGTMELKLPD